MPDFDKNLQPIIESTKFPGFDLNVQEVRPQPMPDLLSGFGGGTSDHTEKSVYQKLAEMQANSRQKGRGVRVMDAQLVANKRYDFFNPSKSQ